MTVDPAVRPGARSIGTRVALASFLAVLLIVVVGGVGLWGVRASTRAALELRAAGDEAHRAKALVASAAELDRVAQQFVHTGIEGFAERARLLAREVHLGLLGLDVSAQDPAIRATVGLMLEHLDGYVTNFEKVVDERRLRGELTTRRMPALAQAVLEEAAGDEALRNEFLEARSAARAYLEELDSANVTLAKAHLSTVAALMSGAARTRVEEYERTFLRAVQATRSYLYLVNVVLAGESAEIAYQGTQLGASSTRIRDTLVRETAEYERRLQRTMSVAFVLALLLAVLSSTWLTRSIVRPIGSVTRTFLALARGEEVDDIPGRGRADELGALAESADAFRAKNRETERLLDDARELSAQLERSNDELEQFVYTVSHDLKAPLVTSMGFIGMIRDLAATGDTERAVQMLERLERPNRRMSALISDLLDLSRVGRTDDERERLDMNAVVADAIELLAGPLEESGATLHVQADLPDLHGQGTRMRQLFENLIGNALKYGVPADGAPSLARVEVGGGIEEEHAVFFVRDHGRGIDPAHHRRIFGLFQRLDSDVEGTGIGLAIAERVVQLHGGRIWVDSRSGEGATFWMAFPCAEPVGTLSE